MDKCPCFSVVIPVYNCEKTIKRAIDSVLNQTFSDFELLICDDCSRDNSVGVIETFLGQDKRIKLFKHKDNKGSAAARNTCLKEASGRYIAFLDADDKWGEDYLKEQKPFLEKHGPIVTCASKLVTNKGSKIFTPRDDIGYKDLLKGNDLYTITTIYDRLFFSNPLFDETFEKNEDYVFWLQLLKNNVSIQTNHKVLVTYFIDKNSKNGNKRKIFAFFKPLYKVYRKSEKINPLRCFILVCKYYFYGKKKYKGLI